MVTCDKPYEWNTTCLGVGRRAIATAPRAKFHVVAYDFGVKRNILRMLAERGCRITVVPAQDQRRRGIGTEAGRRVPVQRARRSRAWLATTLIAATREIH